MLTISGIVKVIHDEKKINDKFKTRDFVVTFDEQTRYPQHVTLTLKNDNLHKIHGIKPGNTITCEIAIRGREWNNPNGVKYFNTIECLNLASANAE